MANPRVFISSTCYDLSEVRDGLFEFIKSYGFEPVLSERGDVFYHPDIHTHDSCLKAVENCQLFILIIGGRFGGSYIADTKKSIVNAEYATAMEQKIPVFTFVKRNVYSDHGVYLKNKRSPSLNSIIFPSIDDKTHAEKIFKFIDDVRLAPVNNGFFPFDFARDIVNLLRKQLAGMFYDFLQERTSSDQLKKTTNLLKDISIAGEKVEELVKSLYRHIDKSADEKIDNVEKHSITKEFFEEIFSDYVLSHLSIDVTSELTKVLVKTARKGVWYDYIANATGGETRIESIDDIHGEPIDYTIIEWTECAIPVDSPNDPNLRFSIKCRKQQERFNIIKELKDPELKKIVEDLAIFKTFYSGLPIHPSDDETIL